jgi:nucleoside-diphosphate-sugar epimerase
VAGPDAPLLYDNIPYVQISERLPGAVRRLFDVMPILKPVIPDPGVPFQLVHHDDVADAIRAGVLGRGEPGVYNLAGPGEVTMADLADALGWYSVPVPELIVGGAGEIVSHLPFVPAEAQWINVGRVSVVMDTSKARRLLGWRPQHDAHETLAELVATARGREPATPA